MGAATDNSRGALSTETVLREEAAAIHGPQPIEGSLGRSQDADEPAQSKLGIWPVDWKECQDNQAQQQAFYRSLFKLDRAALCFSGGGIRSAAFSLGVMQALAMHPRPRPPRDALFRGTGGGSPPDGAKGDSGKQDSGAGGGDAQGGGGLAGDAQRASQQKEQARAAAADADTDLGRVVTDPEKSLLAQFHYLSTVSGGGYIGSWFSAWRRRSDFATVWANLVGRPCGPDVEQGTIAWLRAYSNYLSPKLGITSADFWGGVAISIRNLVLNWLVIVPVLCLVLLTLKIIALVSVGFARLDYAVPNPTYLEVAAPYMQAALSALAGVIFLGITLGFTTRHRPTRCLEDERKRVAGVAQGVDQRTFLRRNLLWLGLAAIFLTHFFASTVTLLGYARYEEALARWSTWLDPQSKWPVIIAYAILGIIIYAAAYAVARPRIRNGEDFGRWSLSGAVFGVVIGIGVYIYNIAPVDGHWIFNDLLLPLLFGVPWVLTAHLLAEMVFVGLTSFEPGSENDREWLGRAAGWVVVLAVCWFIVTFFSFAGSLLVSEVAGYFRTWLGPVGGVSGVVTAILGKSHLSSGRGDNKEAKGAKAISSNIILAIAAPVFAAVLVITLSAMIDELLLSGSLVELLRLPRMDVLHWPWWTSFLWLAFGLVLAAIIAYVASRNININRFSLHAVYRNRLVRAFLGASQRTRSPDAFSGFDTQDNLRAHEVWPPAAAGDRCLFHVINIALNIVSGKRLSWQERKAESFTVSPLHSGSACKAYRSSRHYADPNGISLGTAMAISGAAASPNMGYHSSPAVTFLMALFNVRLGWWLGNPGKEGNKSYALDGPDFAIGPLVKETFGLTTDDQPFVYLSDGGHFENLGLYEMVRRRCRFIIAVDAGADPDYAFEDLGNAVRKIQLDLGVTIRFHKLQLLKRRLKAGEAGTPGDRYHAIGEIDYPAADGVGSDYGTILYIKPGYHGVEGASIRSYAIANETFPHQGTGDQFFSESQFESYRALGFEIADDLLEKAMTQLRPRTDIKLADVFDALPR